MKKSLGMLFVLIMGLSICLAAFSDLATTHWAYDSVMRLTELGIISGMPDGTFRGNDPMTRYQSAVALKRILDYSNTQKGTDSVVPPDLQKRLSELESLVNRSLTAVQKAGEDYRAVMEKLETTAIDPVEVSLDYEDLEKVVGEILDLKLDAKNIEGTLSEITKDVQLLEKNDEEIFSTLDNVALENNNTKNRITELESKLSTYRWISISSGILAIGAIIMSNYVLFK